MEDFHVWDEKVKWNVMRICAFWNLSFTKNSGDHNAIKFFIVNILQLEYNSKTWKWIKY